MPDNQAAPRHPTVRSRATPLQGGDLDFDALLHLAATRAFVLLGECTHGTHEFYAMRAAITRRLVTELGFDAVAVEGDWPDSQQVDAYIEGTRAGTAEEALSGYRRFPSWMWANRDVLDLVRWARGWNATRPPDARVGFHGMDLYSLYRSAEAVIAWLETVDPEQAGAARALYACLDHGGDPQAYGQAAAARLRPSCREDAMRLLLQVLRSRNGATAGERGYPGGHLLEARAQFAAERNAYVVLNAERYYRTMFTDPAGTWNLRDAHMVDTLFALRRHLRAAGRGGRIVVWAHNSHLGDARATGMARRGEWNVGQLVREKAGAAHALLVGFTTYTGHVTAARDWDLPAERRWVRPARRGSHEHSLHASRMDRLFLPLVDGAPPALEGTMLQRAIGVVYRPETELHSHYFGAVLDAQFDAVFHLDETDALEPLQVPGEWARREPPDLYPVGL
jgi:erythromycin esterase-like protein